MSLPNGFLDELRARVSLSQVVGRKVTWDAKKSNAGKGDYWAPCPFHQEKTASFHLDDRKGFYYCFGCHAKGDALNFIRETENVGFMEAVEILAREAGMPMPARDPKAQEKADHATELVRVMDQAVQFYRLQLKTAAAAPARAYLEKRGLPEATLERFEIGFAPDSRTALYQHLTGKGVAPALIVESGLAIKPDDGGTPYDRFRGRIMFPIRDIRGRAIAFGGRAMDPNARAKYLNSPETPLFDKGRTLYNHLPAREAAGKANALVVAEGYMDVIALAQAGIGHAVAPLGTAITEDQLMLLWRLHPEPVIALDGDTAGLRAAMRLIDIALPLLEPGRSLRFCLLPEGLDPDDLIRAQGVGAMQALLDTAKPMIDLLWQRETEGKVLDSPERRAALDASLRAAIAKIRDASIRTHYGAAIKQLRAEIFAPARKNPSQSRAFGGSRRPFGRDVPAMPMPSTITSLLGQAKSQPDTEARLREAVILATCIRHPILVAEFETVLEKLTFQNPGFGAIRDVCLSHCHDDQISGEDLSALVDQETEPGTVEKLLALRHVGIAPALRSTATPDTARMALAEELAKLEAIRGIALEISEAMNDMTGRVDEGLTWRLGQAAEAKNRALRSTISERGVDGEDEELMSNQLQKMIDAQIWVKKKK
jgi:DNA primase